MEFTKKEIIFRDAYSNYFEQVKRFAASFLSSEEEAENVAQDVFLDLWNVMDAIEFRKETAAWLIHSAKWKCLNILRRRRIKDRYSENKKHELHYIALSSSEADNIFCREIAIAYKKTLGLMPEKVRETFRLNREEGLKYGEIAEKLGVSQKTVEYRISLALKSLRAVLKDYVLLLLLMIIN